VFAGSLGGGLAVREAGGAFRVLHAADGLPSEFVTGFLDDRRGGVLVATRKGIVRWVDGRLEGARGAADGLADANVSSMAIDDAGTLWVSTLAGLARDAGGRFVVYTAKHGLPQDAILRMIDDGRGALWMTASKGAFRVEKRDLDALDAGRLARLAPLVVGRAEGMRHPECNGGTQNAGVRLRDGRLAFPTLRGVAMIDPARLPRNAVAPPVAIESVVVGGVEEIPGDVVLVPPDRRRLEILVGGLSFNVPSRVAFRYRLDGFDRDWIDAGTRRTAYYAGLGPGEYVFRAIAANEDGVWSDAGASVRVTITPRFHETTPFWLLCAGAVGLVAFGGYRARVRQLRARAEELERLVALRTKELAAEKEVSERLLLNVLPAPIAERLKRGESKIADSFDAVTVAFADLVGFTQLSARMSAEDLVKLLNEIFSAFDRLSAEHGLEKIKTIGDAYMVVGGLPVARADHAPAVADMALGMVAAIERINVEHGTSLAVRVGVNTGPVVAGVIGERKFIYDLWGDAVNTASRMESHGVPGAVHVTESTRDALGDAFVVEERGVIQVKGKGEMRTFFVRARAGAG
jgi:class 3 adenylate cyclase